MLADLRSVRGGMRGKSYNLFVSGRKERIRASGLYHLKTNQIK